MTKLYISLIILLLLAQAGISRPYTISDTDQVTTSPDSILVKKKGCTFNKGVFLENNELIIPWGAHFDELVKYDNAVVTCLKANGTRVTWYDVTMFNGIHVKSMWCYFSKCYKKTPIKQRLNTLYLDIDTADIAKLKDYLEGFPHHHQPTELAVSKTNYHYASTIDGCNIFLGSERYHAGYVWMQSKEYFR